MMECIQKNIWLQCLIMFKYAATHLIITFMLIFYSGEAVMLVVCKDVFIKKITS